MSDTPPAVEPQPAPYSASPDLKALVIACYVLFLLACINGVTAVIGVVIAHLRRRDAAGTVWQSHFDNLILVFWVFVAAVLILFLSFPLGLWANFSFQFVAHPFTFVVWPPWYLIFPFLFSVIVLPLMVVWYFYRNIRGLLRAGDGRPYRG